MNSKSQHDIDRQELNSRFYGAALKFCKNLEGTVEISTLDCIAFLTTDDLVDISAHYLLQGDLEPGSDPSDRFYPTEWARRYDDKSFAEVASYIDEHRTRLLDYGGYYSTAVGLLYEAAARALVETGFRDRFPSLYFVTFTAFDPNDIFELEERRFIERVNPLPVVEAWRSFE